MTMGWEEEEEEEEDEEEGIMKEGGGGGSQKALPCCIKNFSMRLSTASIGRACFVKSLQPHQGKNRLMKPRTKR